MPALVRISFCTLLAISWVSNGVSDDNTTVIEECTCSCVRPDIPSDEDELKQFVEKETEKIQEVLFVDKTTLSATVRKKTSAEDDRPSAKNVGYMGIVLLGLAGSIIIILDVDYFIKIIHSIATKLFKKKSA